jgi:hypothetical protein
LADDDGGPAVLGAVRRSEGRRVSGGRVSAGGQPLVKLRC